MDWNATPSFVKRWFALYRGGFWQTIVSGAGARFVMTRSPFGAKAPFTPVSPSRSSSIVVIPGRPSEKCSSVSEFVFAVVIAGGDDKTIVDTTRYTTRLETMAAPIAAWCHHLRRKCRPLRVPMSSVQTPIIDSPSHLLQVFRSRARSDDRGRRRAPQVRRIAGVRDSLEIHL